MHRGSKPAAAENGDKPAKVAQASCLSPSSHTSHSSHPVARLTPYAEQLLSRSGAPATPAPSPSEWITTTTAARLTNYSIRWIIGLCDRGFFVEGQEWKQRPPCPGYRKGGRIWIKRSALKKLETERPA